MDDYQKIFVENLKFYRELKDISQAKLAELCDCQPGTIGCIECYRQYPSFEMIIKIAKALNINPADLFLRNASKSKREVNDILQNLLNNDIPNLIREKLSK